MKLTKLLSLFILILTNCGNEEFFSLYDSPQIVAVDSSNNRLFILESDRTFWIKKASDRTDIGAQPILVEGRGDTEDLFDSLPNTANHMAVMAVNGTSRIFISGTQRNNNGDLVFNQILVFNFNGTTLTEASFSPIVTEDNSDDTTDSSHTIGGLAVNEANSQLYVTINENDDDTVNQRLFVYDATDGTESQEIEIAGSPNKMALDNNRLYVANSNSNQSSISVFNANDFNEAPTSIDLSQAIDDISVISNSNGTVLAAKQANDQRVFIRTVDTNTFDDSTAISAGNNTIEDGELDEDRGLNSVVSSVLLTKNSNGQVFAYVPQVDGHIALVTILSDLSSMTSEDIETFARVFENVAVYTNDSGNGLQIFSPASATGDLLFADVGEDAVGLDP